MTSLTVSGIMRSLVLISLRQRLCGVLPIFLRLVLHVSHSLLCAIADSFRTQEST